MSRILGCTSALKKTVCKIVALHQEEEEAAEGAEEAEGEGGAEDGLAWRVHRRYWRLIHVLPQHHQQAQGENHSHICEPPVSVYSIGADYVS